MLGSHTLRPCAAVLHSCRDYMRSCRKEMAGFIFQQGWAWNLEACSPECLEEPAQGLVSHLFEIYWRRTAFDRQFEIWWEI